MDYRNPNDPWLQTGYDPNKDQSADERISAAIIKAAVTVIIVLAAILLIGVFSRCTTPRAVEEHHHHHYEADTMAVRHQVDSQLTSWHEEMTKLFYQKLEQYTSSWSSREGEKETISELITETTDSLGRKVRQEQRTISRDITRELQQQEQRITQEYEARLRVAIDSVNGIYQQRYDSLASHVAQMDSTFVKKTPVGDTRPWYQRLWDNFRIAFVCLLIAAVLWATRKWWMKLLSRLFGEKSSRI